MNTMATDQITGDYGISSYPTTFLIDREGNIASKNLRGEQLSEAVKSAMLR